MNFHDYVVGYFAVEIVVGAVAVETVVGAGTGFVVEAETGLVAEVDLVVDVVEELVCVL